MSRSYGGAFGARQQQASYQGMEESQSSKSRSWRVRATLMWVILAGVFAVWELALPAVEDGQELSEHAFNKPLVAARLRADEGVRR